MLSLIKSKAVAVLVPLLISAVLSGVAYFVGKHQAAKQGGSELAECSAAAPAVAAVQLDTNTLNNTKKKSGSTKTVTTTVVTPQPGGEPKVETTESVEVSFDDLESVDSEIQKYIGSKTSQANPGPRNIFGLTPNYDFESNEIQTALTYDRHLATGDFFYIHFECYAGALLNIKSDFKSQTEIRNAGISGKCGW